MHIETTRFGPVSIEVDDTITFENGLIGLEACSQWALLADMKNPLLGWLQSLDRPDLALAVVNPRHFVSDYKVRTHARDLESLHLTNPRDAQVLVIVNKANDTLALNLKAPLVMHVQQRVGRQIVAKDDHAVQYLLNTTLPLRKTA